MQSDMDVLLEFARAQEDEHLRLLLTELYYEARPDYRLFEEIGHVLWHYNVHSMSPLADASMEPGSFVRTLLELIARADGGNRMRIRRGFPVYVRLMADIGGRDDGIEVLKELQKRVAPGPVGSPADHA